MFPIHIQGIDGAYIVRAQEFDDSDPMASMVEARRYVDWEFGEFLVTDEEDADAAKADDDATHRCPYCSSDQGCEHLLLLVDMTFRDAEGGPLFESFNTRWYGVQSEGLEDPKFLEGDAFDACIEEVETVAGPGDGFDFDGGPGRSSHYQVWYLPSKEEVTAAVEAYRRLIVS